MICPHCHKPISYNIEPKALALAKKLRAEGFSLRDIEFKLKQEGYHASFSSLSRHFRRGGQA